MDLVQEGSLGLIKAAEKFDYSKNFKSTDKPKVSQVEESTLDNYQEVDQNTEEQTTVEQEQVAATVMQKGFVNGCIKLNVRTNPTIDSEVVEIINESDEVTIKDVVNEWYSVITKDGNEGYCMSKYITVK